MALFAKRWEMRRPDGLCGFGMGVGFVVDEGSPSKDMHTLRWTFVAHNPWCFRPRSPQKSILGTYSIGGTEGLDSWESLSGFRT